MRPKSSEEHGKRNEVQYEQLILELPLHRPPQARVRADEDERDRGVVVIDLY